MASKTKPKCSAPRHKWSRDHALVGGLRENPGVWSHGGGIRIVRQCVHCGAREVTDTWSLRFNRRMETTLYEAAHE